MDKETGTGKRRELREDGQWGAGTQERKHKVGGNTYGRTARPLGKII